MKKTIIYIARIYLGITTAALLAEVLLLPIAKYFPDSRLLSIGLVGLFVWLRLKQIRIIPSTIAKLNYYLLLPILFIITVWLLQLERIHGLNFVLAEYQLSYSRLVYLTLTSAVTALYQPAASFRRFIKQAIFTLPFILFLVALFLLVRRNDLFRLFIQEDHLVEVLQVVLFLGSSILSFLLAKFWMGKQKLVAIAFAVVGLAFLIMVGEEISWGQRIIGVETPDHIAETNLQNEINLHNHQDFFGLVYRGYMLIGLIGSTAWIGVWLIKSKISTLMHKILNDVVPQWFFAPYFAAAFIYNYDRFFFRPHLYEIGVRLWEEPMELLLILGIFLFLLSRLLLKRPLSLKKAAKRLNLPVKN